MLDIIGILVQILIAGATLYLAKKIHEHGQTVAKAERTGEIINALNNLNALALSSQENLEAIDSLYPDKPLRNENDKRKRWATFLTLQVHSLIFKANADGFVSDEYLEQHTAQVLDRVLADKEVCYLIENRGFDPLFVKYCQGRQTYSCANN